MKFKYGPHYGIDEDFYCMVFWVLRVCPAAQERAWRLCAEIAGEHAAALYDCVTTGETMPDVERRHGLTLNTLLRYVPILYRRMCGENVGVWEPQQLPEWSRSTSQKRHKTATENGRFFERENAESARLFGANTEQSHRKMSAFSSRGRTWRQSAPTDRPQTRPLLL